MPSGAEKTALESDIEMRKIDETRPEIMTRDEQRAYNRQLFLNLPKTPSTPFHNSKTPMTPRTVAFTKLSGDDSAVPVSQAGPSRALPFREHYAVPDGS